MADNDKSEPGSIPVAESGSLPERAQPLRPDNDQGERRSNPGAEDLWAPIREAALANIERQSPAPASDLSLRSVV